MLHLSSRIGQTGNVSQFHQFESTFFGHRSREATAQEENRARFRQEVNRFLDGTRVLEVRLHQVRRLLQVLDQVPAVGFREVSGTSKLRGKNGQGTHHVGEGFGRGDGLFRPRVNVDASSTQTSDGGANDVDHAEHLSAFELDFFDRRNGVCGLARL